MKQVLSKQGGILVDEVPAPRVEPGTVLVLVDHSCISVGTEMACVKAGGEPLWMRGLRNPQLVQKAMKMASTQGIRKTRQMIHDRGQASSAMGYSAAGVVVEVGRGVTEFQVGDRVACAGAQCAHHAQYIRVPTNLTVPVPDQVELSHASSVALGAIAMQGVRRAVPTLGETFVVIGLGILGQMAVQMLRANGCRVIGTDLDRDRIDLAKRLGMEIGFHPDDGQDIDQVARLTDGIGADGVIITAATPSSEVLSGAFKMCRRKGRVVLVGDVGLDINRADIYQKELDFFVSTSYGPGRYDSAYEEDGADYPVAYVRWTENRNMSEYLRLLGDRRIDLKPMVSAVYPVDDAAEAYQRLKDPTDRPMMVLLNYPQGTDADAGRPACKVANRNVTAAGSGKLRIGVIGAGSFALGMHLPNLRKMDDRFQIQAIADRIGHTALSVAKQFGAGYSTTDYGRVLEDPEVDAVMLTTRHDQHARIALEALEAGKHVLVEKPMVLTVEELEQIKEFYACRSETDAPVLLTAFNRRFSPAARRIRELTENRSNPMIINYVMNAGYIPLDHWVHGEEGGGRNLGEACHIYDLFTCLTGSRVGEVTTMRIAPSTGYYSRSDNFVASMTFEDGSVGTLTYTALGASEYPKEQMQVFCDGRVIVLDDYRRVTVAGSKRGGMKLSVADKGHKREVELLGETIQNGGQWPIPLWQQIQATEIAFRVEQSLTQPEATRLAAA